MQLDIVVAFFLLGAVAQALKAPIKVPAGLYQSLTLFLLLAIGLKGGVALSSHGSLALLWQSLAVIAFGLLLPLIAFPLLHHIGGFNRVDSASVAAHYGSVSVATFAVAIALLEANQIGYEPYFPLFVALLEVPAIGIGLWLALRGGSLANPRAVLHEVALNQGVLLLCGGILIGWWAGERSASVMPFFGQLFHGVLALFLLEMGRVAAARFHSLIGQGSFIVCFAIMMPLIGAVAGTALAVMLQLSPGGIVLMATLGASASYIAVPAAMAVALPAANPGLSISASLAVTFPFNVIVGIPLYSALIGAYTS
ncbi:sodium-dependent bicarbonate transport family permease [Marinobacterium arenosum]|uniref:sodium-dependent bicarbonate transport family permease n=1 Tax=Marinobacterium arenosum TaxID=2862496 RepID=UPI001C93DD59|nr:sodium-dependent bicarbonate transport family permease [Marinobacterium arenosum]MBY4678115.1 sodium-dependent bicarbonate transport family permease [Marinobacterium arenosum]